MGVEGLSGGCRRENRGTQAGRRDPSSLQRGGSGRIEAEQASFGHELVEGVGDLEEIVEDHPHREATEKPNSEKRGREITDFTDSTDEE